MIDILTKKPLLVTDDEQGGPYIELAYSQVEQVRRVLESTGIKFWVMEHVLSVNGGPGIAIIALGRNGNASAVQAVLDNAS